MKHNHTLGIGIDVVDVTRFQKIPYASNKDFYKKIFNSSEINYCLKFKDSYRHFAGKFAIKEAVKKSIPKQVRFLDILTSHRKEKPTVKLRHNIGYVFIVSVSHDATVAAAIVLSILK